MKPSNSSSAHQTTEEDLLNRFIVRVCKMNEKSCHDVTVQPAKDFIDFLKGAAVLKDQYQQSGLIEESHSNFVFNEGITHAGSILFLAQRGTEVLGTIAVMDGSQSRLPCMALFANEIAALDLRQRKYVEVGTLSVRRDEAPSNLVFKLYFRAMIYALFVDRVDDIFIQVREESAAFYVKNFLFTRVGPAKRHPGYCGLRASLLRVDVRSLKARLTHPEAGGTYSWLKRIYSFGLQQEFRTIVQDCAPDNRFHLDKKDISVYRFVSSF